VIENNFVLITIHLIFICVDLSLSFYLFLLNGSGVLIVYVIIENKMFFLMRELLFIDCRAFILAVLCIRF
jgi:hypothetical protein